MKSNDGSAEESTAKNMEIEQLCVPNSVGAMNSTADSVSENAMDQVSAKTPNVPASDNGVVQSRSEGRRDSQAHDDSLSCGNGIEEHGIKDTNTGDGTKEECIKHVIISEEGPEVLPNGGALSGDFVDPPFPSSTERNDDMEIETDPGDETDDSDMVELDVKVCDTCGDAGPEDTLAFCRLCSDGAEHIHCMRSKLSEIPEGEWVCEGCKSGDWYGNGCQEKTGRMDENDKGDSSGEASSGYVNSSDIEGRRAKSHQNVSRKRYRDDVDAEVSSIAKKPALESIHGSVKSSSASKTAALSRENSMKNIDKPKVSPHSSSDANPVNNTTESATAVSDLRVHKVRGTFSKSNSFNSLNSKPKVQLIERAVIQRQKSGRDSGSFRVKDGAVPLKSMGKSMSFKSTNSSRPEPKTKMMSPRLSHIQDTINAKRRSLLELQQSSRAEHPPVNSMKGSPASSTPRTDRRPASRGESSLSITANHQETRAECKLSGLSRLSSLAVRRPSDLSNSSGEFKRLPASGLSTPRFSSTNGVNSSEQKSNMSSLKESPSSVVPDRSPVIANESIPDALPQSKDSTNSGERMREPSGNRLGLPSAKSSRDETDTLKAALEAAILKKPGGYRKNRAVGQSEGSSFSSHLPNYAGNKKLGSDTELPDRTTWSQNLNLGSLNKGTFDNVKQSSMVSAEGVPPSGRQDGASMSPSSRNMFPSAMSSFLKSLALPEHEFIWQGSFVIHRNGKSSDLWNGVQAHLSTCASSKVIEAVNKFKNRIVLYEVPRSITWPIQFQEDGVREDNIALFFFAKDLESYEKIYKVLLDNMMKNDLALKGNVDGVELLIFPSNQLPDNYQRWNMLFFLWGVFRGKKESFQHHVSEPYKQRGAQDIPQPIMSVPDNRCSHQAIAVDLPVTKDTAPLLEASTSEKLQTLSSPTDNGDFCTRASSSDQLDRRLNSGTSTAVLSAGEKNCQEIKGPCEEGAVNSRSSPSLVVGNTNCSGNEQIQSSHHSSKSVEGAKDTVGEGTTTNKTYDQNQNQVNLRKNAGDQSLGDSCVKNDYFLRDLNVEPERGPFHDEEYMFPGSSAAPQPLDPTSSQVLVRSDGTHDGTRRTLEKMNHMPSGLHHEGSHVETLILGGDENAERHFFPVQQSHPWKTHSLVQDRVSDRAPNLDLALGADRRLLLANKEEHPKVNEEHSVKVAGVSKVDEDASASLSLSLSFPFPQSEVDTKPPPKTERSSMLLFSKLGEN